MAERYRTAMAEPQRRDQRSIDRWSKVMLVAFPALVLGSVALLFGLVVILLRLMKAQP